MLLHRQLMIWFSFSWLISFFELWNLWISHFMTSRKYSSFLTLSMQTKSIIFCTNVGNWKLMLSIKVMKISLFVSMRLVSKFLNRTMYQLTTISRVLAYSLFTTYKNQIIKRWKMKINLPLNFYLRGTRFWASWICSQNHFCLSWCQGQVAAPFCWSFVPGPRIAFSDCISKWFRLCLETVLWTFYSKTLSAPAWYTCPPPTDSQPPLSASPRIPPSTDCSPLQKNW